MVFEETFLEKEIKESENISTRKFTNIG